VVAVHLDIIRSNEVLKLHSSILEPHQTQEAGALIAEDMAEDMAEDPRCEDATACEEESMRLIDSMRWAELHICIAVHEQSHLVLAVGYGPNRYRRKVTGAMSYMQKASCSKLRKCFVKLGGTGVLEQLAQRGLRLLGLVEVLAHRNTCFSLVRV
jgi:hypothetical protein